MTDHQPLQASDGQGQAPATPNRKDLADMIEQAYREFFVYRATQTPTSGFVYASQVTKLLEWLRESESATSRPKPPLQERKMK